jgi:hypothetical protein
MHGSWTVVIAGAALLLQCSEEDGTSAVPRQDAGLQDQSIEGAAGATGGDAQADAPAADSNPADAAQDVPGLDSAAACGTSTPEELILCVDPSRFEQDLSTIAQPRPPGSPHWQAVQDLCAARFQQYGYQVELHDYGSGINVVGTHPGKTSPKERIVVSAHYDSTDSSCPGADDNASGVAGTLEAARVLATAEFDRTLVVACWDEEEGGLKGSAEYAARARTQGDDILAAYVFEMIGYYTDVPNSQTFPTGFELAFPLQIGKVAADGYRGNFVAMIHDVVANPRAQDALAFADLVGLKYVDLGLSVSQVSSPDFSDLRRSDHASFWGQYYPALCFGDTAEFRNEAYHCNNGDDTADRLNTPFATRIIQIVTGSAARALGLP